MGLSDKNKGLSIHEGKLETHTSSFDSIKADFARHPEKIPEFTREIVELYKINEGNLEKVQNQGWVSRLWNTLSGKNERLREKNLENLSKIQEIGVGCIEQLAIENETFRHCFLNYSEEIKSIQFANIRVREFLVSLLFKLEERFKKYDSHVDGYSEEDLTEEQKELTVCLLVYLAQVDGKLSPQEELLIKNKIERFGLTLSYQEILQHHPSEMKEFFTQSEHLNKLSKYDKLTRAIIYKNLVEMVHCDKNKEEREEEALTFLKPFLKLDEQELARIENDLREYIMGESTDAYVYLHTKDKRIKITPSDLKPSEEKKHELKESFLHLLSTGKEEKVMTQLPGSSDAVSTTKAEDAIPAEDTIESLTKLGEEYCEKEEYTKAKGYFEKALELDSQHAPAYVNLGACILVLAEEPQEAQKGIELLHKSIELDQNNTDAYFILGQFFYNIEEYSTSVESVREVLRLKPDFIEAHELLIDILKEAGGDIKIIEEYHDILEKNPKDPYIHWGLGRAYYESWETEKAIKHLKKAISLKSDFYESYLALGQVYLDWWGAGDYPKAVQELEKAVKIEPERTEAYFWLGQAYHKSKSHKKALDAYRKLKDLDYDLAQKLSQKIKGSIKKALN